MNESGYNRKRFLTLPAVRVTDYFNSLTKPERVISLVPDDSVIPRERSKKKAELLSRVYDHVKGRTIKGFNMLTLGRTDNYSFVPVAFNMMASADEKNRLVPASASIDKRNSGYKNRKDAVERKPEAAVKMIHDALAAGIQAAYVLMDNTWFTNEPFIKKVVDEGIGVIGMLKDNRQRYYYKGRLYNLKQLAALMDFLQTMQYFRFRMCEDHEIWNSRQTCLCQEPQ